MKMRFLEKWRYVVGYWGWVQQRATIATIALKCTPAAQAEPIHQLNIGHFLADFLESEIEKNIGQRILIYWYLSADFQEKTSAINWILVSGSSYILVIFQKSETEKRGFKKWKWNGEKVKASEVGNQPTEAV